MAGRAYAPAEVATQSPAPGPGQVHVPAVGSAAVVEGPSVGERVATWWPGRRLGPIDVGAVVLLVGLAVLLVVLRHSGQPPFGSDHDEYRMVANALWSRGEPVVAGIEATKYPVGYPAVLGLLARLGLPITGAAVGLNMVLAVGVVLTAWWLVRRPGTLVGADLPARRLAGVVAGLLVVGSAWLWDSTWSVMPDTALTAVVAAVVLGYLRTTRPRHVAWLAVAVAGAVLLKSIAIVLAGAVTVGLLFDRPGLRRWAWAPAVAGLVAVAGQALWTAGYPAHTTGYLQTVLLRDPYDAAEGELGLPGLLARVPGRLDDYLTSLANAVVGPPDGGWVGIAVAVGLLAVAVVALREARGFATVLVVGYAAALAMWPYASPRFGLPMLPLAAVGAGALAARFWTAVGAVAPRTSRPTTVRGLVAVLLLVGVAVVHVRPAIGSVQQLAAAEADRFGGLRPAVADALAWMRDHVGEHEVVASLDYREIAYRLDRPVTPVAYTTEAAVLRDQVGDADWFVALSGLYGPRDRIAARVVEVLGDRLVPAHTTDRVDIYRVRPAS